MAHDISHFQCSLQFTPANQGRRASLRSGLPRAFIFRAFGALVTLPRAFIFHAFGALIVRQWILREQFAHLGLELLLR